MEKYAVPSFDKLNYDIQQTAMFYDTYSNNYTHAFVNKDKELADIVEKRKSSLSLLNQGSYDLYDFCIACLTEFKDQHSLLQSEYQKINIIVKNWRNLLRSGNSFTTYEYFSAVVSFLKSWNFPFIDKLHQLKNRYILNSFLDVSKHYKEFVKVGCYGDRDQMHEYLDKTLKILKENNHILNAIERLELARLDFPLIINSEEKYPLFSITFDYDIVTRPYHPIVSEFVELFCHRDADQDWTVGLEYNLAVTSNLALSQGFKNYKKYLNVMGILDSQYDKEQNYAFIKKDLFL